MFFFQIFPINKLFFVNILSFQWFGDRLKGWIYHVQKYEVYTL